MILSKLVIKTLFYDFILNNHISAVYIRKKINGFIGVMVLTLVMTSLLPRLYDVSMIRCFSFLILLCPQVTHYKIICEETQFDYCN